MKSHSDPMPNTPALPPSTRRGLLGMASAGVSLVFWPNAPLAGVSIGKDQVNSVANFDETSWAKLVKSGPRPAAYVFTTTYCSTCPDAFEKLQAFITASRQKVELAAVVMDEQGVRALKHAHHYAGATRIYAFDGFEPAIRQSVDPNWPNVTPFVVLIGRSGVVQRSIGPPDAAALKKWLG